MPSNFYPRPPRGGRRITASRQSGLLWDFYPRPPRGGRHRLRPFNALRLLFLSTPSARRATYYGIEAKRPFVGFLSTPSARRATLCTVTSTVGALYFYPRPPRGGRPLCEGCPADRDDISIHALREEGDQQRPAGRKKSRPISIHALREEGDGSQPQKGRF